MSDITEYHRKQGEDGLFYSWPDFWHTFANKHPMKSAADHKWHQGRHKFCFYCLLEERAGEMLIEDKGVTIIRIPDEKGA